MTAEQAMALTRGQEIHAGTCTKHIGSHGGVHERHEVWRVNGKMHKRKGVGLRFTVPIKHGLRDFMYLTEYNRKEFHLASECQPTIVRAHKTGCMNTGIPGDATECPMCGGAGTNNG